MKEKLLAPMKITKDQRAWLESEQKRTGNSIAVIIRTLIQDKIKQRAIIMIKINDEWTIRKETNQWVLTEHYIGKDKDGNDKPKERDRFFAKASQVFSYILNERISTDEDQTLTDILVRQEVLSQKLGKSLDAYFEKLGDGGRVKMCLPSQQPMN